LQQAREHVAQIGERFDAELIAYRDGRVDHGRRFVAFVATGEQPISYPSVGAADGQAPAALPPQMLAPKTLSLRIPRLALRHAGASCKGKGSMVAWRGRCGSPCVFR
jgi:hypothetical protein